MPKQVMRGFPENIPASKDRRHQPTGKGNGEDRRKGSNAKGSHSPFHTRKTRK